MIIAILYADDHKRAVLNFCKKISKNEQTKLCFCFKYNVMKINKVSNFPVNNITHPNKKNEDVHFVSTHFDKIDCTKISFGAMLGIKNKKIDIEKEKSKMLRQIDSVLETYTGEIDEDDYLLSLLKKSIQWHYRVIYVFCIFYC